MQRPKSGSLMLLKFRGRGTSTDTMLFTTPGAALITAMRSQSITDSSRLWVTRITVFLSRSQMRSSSSRSSSRVCASRLANGSSMRITSGSLANARAIATFCFMPPESSCGCEPLKSKRRTISRKYWLTRFIIDRCSLRNSGPRGTFSSTVRHGIRAAS